MEQPKGGKNVAEGEQQQKIGQCLSITVVLGLIVAGMCENGARVPRSLLLWQARLLCMRLGVPGGCCVATGARQERERAAAFHGFRFPEKKF